MDITPPAKVVIITTAVYVHFRLYKLSTIYTEIIVCFTCVTFVNLFFWPFSFYWQGLKWLGICFLKSSGPFILTAEMLSLPIFNLATLRVEIR